MYEKKYVCFYLCKLLQLIKRKCNISYTCFQKTQKWDWFKHFGAVIQISYMHCMVETETFTNYNKVTKVLLY